MRIFFYVKSKILIGLHPRDIRSQMLNQKKRKKESIIGRKDRCTKKRYLIWIIYFWNAVSLILIINGEILVALMIVI